MTVREALASSAGRIGSNPAKLLLQHAAAIDGVAFLNSLDLPLQEQALRCYQEYVDRAAGGEPVQYILGNWDFYGRTYTTDRRALIPRPETERLVEEALKAIPKTVKTSVVDAGSGTGCVGISIKLERPHARVTLIDVSDEALSLSVQNAADLHADVRIVRADMRQPLPGGPYGVIVSNPPYVDAADMRALPDSVRKFEPELALYGGEDGMDFVRALADRAADSLEPGGRLFAEIGYNQAERALSVMRAAGLDAVAIPDYSGIPRVVAARRGT